MEQVVLVIHLLLALAIIGLVLIQRSEGGGLGIGGGGGMGQFASARATANVLTRATAVCAAGFFVTSLVLAYLAGMHSQKDGILETYGSGSEAAAPLDPESAGESAQADGEAPAVPSARKALQKAPESGASEGSAAPDSASVPAPPMPEPSAPIAE